MSCNYTTSTSSTLYTTPNCKYFLPCGWCELKKERCSEYRMKIDIPTVPWEDSWYPGINIPVTVYGCPSFKPTTYSLEEVKAINEGKDN